MAPRVLALSGSIRTGSYNTRLLHLVAERLKASGVDVTVLDLKKFPLPIYNGDLEEEEGLPEAAKSLKDLFSEHHGLLIATPEYNGGYTPLLKNTLDWVSRQETEAEGMLSAYQNKVVALVAASPGQRGGVRSLTALRTLLEGMRLTVLDEQLAVGNAEDSLPAEGFAFTDSVMEADLDRFVTAFSQKLLQTVPA